MENLLISKESECRTGGLNILGSLCGLGYNYAEADEKNILQIKNLFIFWRKAEKRIPYKVWKQVYDI